MYQDFNDLIASFNAGGVEFLVVGAHALAAHGHVRATKDLDIWVRPTADNAQRVIKALHAFGAPLQGLTVEDLMNPNIFYQMGLPPVRIDILTSIMGVNFDEAWKSKLVTEMGGHTLSVLSKDHLIAAKRAVGRKQDLADVEKLEGKG